MIDRAARLRAIADDIDAARTEHAGNPAYQAYITSIKRAQAELRRSAKLTPKQMPHVVMYGLAISFLTVKFMAALKEQEPGNGPEKVP